MGALNVDDRRAVSGPRDNTLRVWDLNRAGCDAVLPLMPPYSPALGAASTLRRRRMPSDPLFFDSSIEYPPAHRALKAIDVDRKSNDAWQVPVLFSHSFTLFLCWASSHCQERRCEDWFSPTVGREHSIQRRCGHSLKARCYCTRLVRRASVGSKWRFLLGIYAR